MLVSYPYLRRLISNPYFRRLISNEKFSLVKFKSILLILKEYHKIMSHIMRDMCIKIKKDDYKLRCNN